MKLPRGFTADGPEMGDFDAIPRGKYPFMFIKSEIELTKLAKKEKNPEIGQLLKLQARVIAGEFKDKIVFVQLNITNKESQIAVDISNKELTSICMALGLAAIDDTDELHGIPFWGTIKVVVDKDEKYPDKNEFTKYEKYDGAAPTSSSPDKQKKDKPRSKAPWEKKK